MTRRARLFLFALVAAHGQAVASEADVAAGEIRLTGTGAVALPDSAGAAARGDAHTIPYFPTASDALGRQGFARIVNLSDSAGTVSIVAFDDGGRRHGPVTLSLDARQTVHINSVDLEDGEASKGLPAGVGAPSQGDWRLELSSELAINVLSYIRTRDGFVTSMHDVAPSEGNTHRVPFFNPGSNTAQESLLRLVNPGAAEASVTVRGVDDLGAAAPGGAVTLTLPPHASRTVSAMDLEDGAAGLGGSLGDGAGKWRLEVDSDSAIMAISMLSTPTGHLTNLSTDPAGAPSDDRLPAPEVEVTGDREFKFSWKWSVEAGETYAFDYGPRLNRGDWGEDCGSLSASATGEDTITATYTTNADLTAGTVIEARYRFRNASSCDAGSPGSWSRTGSYTVPGDGGGTRAPDLVVESASVDDDTPDAGASFTLSATVRNRGDGQSAATTLRYYQSSNSTISDADTEVGTDPVGGLTASATSAESTALTAPSSAGTYYYGACVDAVTGESSTSNNCSDGINVKVADSGGNEAADLVVESASVDDDTPDAGTSFTLSATVRNRGDGQSQATTLRYYRSSNSRISSTDAEVGTDPVGGLVSGATSRESITLTAPSSAGMYYYGACVDSVTGESSPSNNCSDGAKVDISAPQGADVCAVNLRRSVQAGGVERIALVPSDAVHTEVGTTEAPVVVSAGMDTRLDHDIYRVTLDERSRLVVLGTGDLDTEAIAVTGECAQVGAVARDVGSLPDADPSNQNFLVRADLDAGTYYIVVFEWTSRQGGYGLEFAFGEEVSQKPVVGAIPDQEVSLDARATLFVPVEDDDGDLHHVTAFAEDPETMGAWVRLRSGVAQLILDPGAAGTTTVYVLATDRRGQVGFTAFDVAVPASTSPAPEVAAGDADGQLTITFESTLDPRETRAYDFQLRSKRPQLPWEGVGCVEFENSASTRVTENLSVVVNGLRHGVSVDARYRSRESASCGTGEPAPWSSPGSGPVAGTPVNQRPEFGEADDIERRIDENASSGINVGAPVVARDPDGIRDELTYSLAGPDKDSFDIVPDTGQIRTRQDVHYDYETKSEYRVDVEAVDVFGEKDRTSVSVTVGDLEPNCTTPEDIRLNAGDGRLWARWRPVVRDSERAAVLGYQVEYRAGTTGNWIRLADGGHGGRFVEIPGLFNDLAYWVRVRPVGDESDCNWSTPVEGTPTTDRAPRNARDFNDRFVPHDRLGDWSFPVRGRCAEHRGEQIDCSYEYRKTSPHRGTITLEYDDGRPGCAVGLLFSSLTAGSFLDECGNAGVAGVEVPFKIEPPPESGLAPQSRSEFDKLVFGNYAVLPGFLFGQLCRGPVCNRIKLNGKPSGEPVHPGLVNYSGADGVSSSGRYWYEPPGLATGRLEIEVIQGGGCVYWGDRGCEDQDGGDRLRFRFDLKFEGPNIASFTVTIYRNGIELSTDTGILDFQKGSPGNRLPTELVPPRSPPQAAGKDYSGVGVAARTTTPAITGNSLQSLLLRDAGVQTVAYRPGDWLEPKDGSNQRMMVVGADHGTSTVALSPKRSPTRFQSAAFVNAEPEFTRLAVVCMQQDNAIPVRGSRFFSQPKTASGPVQACQRDCVLADGKAIQACVWDCEANAERGVTAVGSGKSKQLPRLHDAGSPTRLPSTLQTPVMQKRPALLVRPDDSVTVSIGEP